MLVQKVVELSQNLSLQGTRNVRNTERRNVLPERSEHRPPPLAPAPPLGLAIPPPLRCPPTSPPSVGGPTGVCGGGAWALLGLNGAHRSR